MSLDDTAEEPDSFPEKHGHTIHLKKSQNYNFQVPGQIRIRHSAWYDFTAWTTEELLVEGIVFNQLPLTP